MAISASLESWPSADRPLIAAELFWTRNVNVERVLFLARLPIILFALLFGALAARWGRERYGPWAFLLVLFLFAFSPNLIVFAGLATTDLATTALIFAAIYTLRRYWQDSTWISWGLAGVTLGLALATKITALILLPLSLLLLLLYRWRSQAFWRLGAGWLSLLLPAGFVFWALFRFELRAVPGFPLPSPAATFLDEFFHVSDHLDAGHLAFFRGETATEGWWSYFIVAFFIKIPVPALILILVGILYLLWQGPSHWRQTAVLWLPPALLFWQPSLAVSTSASAMSCRCCPSSGCSRRRLCPGG